jgi:CBS domain containing-hemolysin-like protein
VLTELGRIPVEGDEVALPEIPADEQDPGGWLARVEKMDGRRIDRVLLTPVTESALASHRMPRRDRDE